MSRKKRLRCGFDLINEMLERTLTTTVSGHILYSIMFLAWRLRIHCILRQTTVFPPSKLFQAVLLLRIECILRRATVFPSFQAIPGSPVAPDAMRPGTDHVSPSF